MENRHLPAEDYKAKLEWLLLTELRRQERLERGKSRWRWLRTAALVALSILVGAAGVKASEGWQRHAEAELLAARARIHAELAERRLELAKEYFQREEEELQAGTKAALDVEMAQVHLFEIETEAQLARLNQQEVEQTGQSPRTEIDAPLVAGRDFVAERMEAELAFLQRRLEAGRRFHEEAPQGVGDGVFSPSELYDSRRQVELIGQEIQQQLRRLQLRKRFVAGDVTARDVLAAEQRERLRAHAEATRQRLEGARLELEDMRRRAEAGLMDELDFKHFEFQVEQLDAEYRLAELERQLSERNF